MITKSKDIGGLKSFDSTFKTKTKIPFFDFLGQNNASWSSFPGWPKFAVVTKNITQSDFYNFFPTFFLRLDKLGFVQKYCRCLQNSEQIANPAHLRRHIFVMFFLYLPFGLIPYLLPRIWPGRLLGCWAKRLTTPGLPANCFTCCYILPFWVLIFFLGPSWVLMFEIARLMCTLLTKYIQQKTKY